MDNSLQALCDAIKKILTELKPKSARLSFVVVTGKNAQGKSALLKQSAMEEVPVLSEQAVSLYYNQEGIFVELGENWLIHRKTLLQNTLKRLNRCNPYLKITGLVLCMDVNELLLCDSTHWAAQKKAHLQLLAGWGHNLGYPVELALLFTKMDTLAGFSEFYQADHVSELSKPLGFSLDSINQLPKKMETYHLQFDQLIETLNQQVIHKMHPVRSTIKRSLIREFPLQLANLRAPTSALIRGISPQLFHLHAIYFTSAQQGGISTDRLNKKIQHEYALMVQDVFPQATNYKAYFVEGALKKIQEQCGQAPPMYYYPPKMLIGIAASIAGVSLLLVSYTHYKTSHLLDKASKELLAYDVLHAQGSHAAQALYHLSKAANTVDQIGASSAGLHQLKRNLRHHTQNGLQGEFIPSLINELEQQISLPNNTPLVRYKALKIYLMLGQPGHLVSKEVQDWFANQWKGLPVENLKKQLALLNHVMDNPLQNVFIKQQVISDTRNYLNALPMDYLYYSLAQEYFPKDQQQIAVQGFHLADTTLPAYFTKAGFNNIMQHLPAIAQQLQGENWVLARQDLSSLQEKLIRAYCFNYVTWWQNFLRKSQPMHYQDYQQGRQITRLLQQSNAIYQLLSLVQQETKPDLSEELTSFNQEIAPQFTELNLISLSSTKELGMKIAELEKFISTLSVVKDAGKTAFTITKSRFVNENSSDPVSLLYNQAKLLPEPLSTWAYQIANDAWSILIKDSRPYINQQWQQTVYREFQNTIAKRYPFESSQLEEISIEDFNKFFAKQGTLNTFAEQYIKPFLDISQPQWKPKSLNDLVLPIASETVDEIIRANIITNMFFPDHSEESKIAFSLQKISLDPVISSLDLEIGETKLADTQDSESLIYFTWPQNNAKLSLHSIEGNDYELTEQGAWALFKLLEKVNVLVDEQDSSSLQILFEVNSNSGRYLLKTNNQINPFTPGILNGFTLNEAIV